MIHATFEDGTTALFAPREQVWVCRWVEGDYIDGEELSQARWVVKPGVYVLDRAPKDGGRPSETKIVKVRRV